MRSNFFFKFMYIKNYLRWVNGCFCQMVLCKCGFTLPSYSGRISVKKRFSDKLFWFDYWSGCWSTVKCINAHFCMCVLLICDAHSLHMILWAPIVIQWQIQYNQRNSMRLVGFGRLTRPRAARTHFLDHLPTKQGAALIPAFHFLHYCVLARLIIQ